MKAYWEIEAELHPFLTLVLDTAESGQLSPREKAPQYPISRTVGGTQAGFNIWIGQKLNHGLFSPQSRHCTDWATQLWPITIKVTIILQSSKDQLITHWMVMHMTYQCLLWGNGNNSHRCGGTAHSRLLDPCLVFHFSAVSLVYVGLPKVRVTSDDYHYIHENTVDRQLQHDDPQNFLIFEFVPK